MQQNVSEKTFLNIIQTWQMIFLFALLHDKGVGTFWSA
jgi:hypothetical protein